MLPRFSETFERDEVQTQRQVNLGLQSFIGRTLEPLQDGAPELQSVSVRGSRAETRDDVFEAFLLKKGRGSDLERREEEGQTYAGGHPSQPERSSNAYGDLFVHWGQFGRVALALQATAAKEVASSVVSASSGPHTPVRMDGILCSA